MKKLLLLIFFIGFLGNSQTIDYKLYDEFLKKHVSEEGIVDYIQLLEKIV